MTTTCERKTRYPNEARAQRAARKRSHATGDIIKEYPCTNCGGYHIGHPSLKALRGTG